MIPDGHAGIEISIHALREEGDGENADPGGLDRHFNPRPPRGGRPPRYAARIAGSAFQSTPSARRATWLVSGDVFAVVFQSTPSARRATLRSVRQDVRNDISIHALREEGDGEHKFHSERQTDFNPRPPRGGRLSPFPRKTRLLLFQSTPSARRATAGGRSEKRPGRNFNPRPPRGGRPGKVRPGTYMNFISIHALREEGDQSHLRPMGL